MLRASFFCLLSVVVSAHRGAFGEIDPPGGIFLRQRQAKE
jgi:hypothetical protein